ncbi:hypothetical protein CcCBS67573_g07465 [Chytriomyces confervae]|uniref:Transcription factor IIIC subunit 5 HTH domain-containing protein n=1 Tax=Chytriomyces confervae TaxID=246404 RepID=A0A507EWL5_9FUNG|nr:hypothetical protein CcCBS67573_g07465 [Chytriomyces confervae]
MDTDPQFAPSAPLRNWHFHVVEMPGRIIGSDPQNAIAAMNGMDAVAKAFSQDLVPLELSLRPNDPFAHPLLGEIIPTANLLLKVTRKRRKTGSGPNGEYLESDYKIETEIAGIIVKTGRFRALADYQYGMDPNDPMVQLKKSLNSFKIEGISKFDFSLDKGIQKDLRNVPPPVFSRIEWSQRYRYQQFSKFTGIEVLAESGETRIIRKPQLRRNPCLKFTRESVHVPTAPTSAILTFLDSLKSPPEMLAHIESLFQQRPIHTFHAVSNLCKPVIKRKTDVKLIHFLLSRFAYFMTSGPWRECWVRYGYDPRMDRDARVYQVISMRFVKAPQPLIRAKRLIGVPSGARLLGVIHGGITGENEDLENDKSHMFDGTLWKGNARLQICDITDPDVVKIVQSYRGIRKTFDTKDGWYEPALVDSIRKIVRNKIMLQSGRSAEDVDMPDYDSDDDGAASPTEENEMNESDEDEASFKDAEDGQNDVDMIGPSDHVSTKIDALMRTLQSSQLVGTDVSTQGIGSGDIDVNGEDEFDYFEAEDEFD